jgi:hypothetical protein
MNDRVYPKINSFGKQGEYMKEKKQMYVVDVGPDHANIYKEIYDDYYLNRREWGYGGDATFHKCFKDKQSAKAGLKQYLRKNIATMEKIIIDMCGD